MIKIQTLQINHRVEPINIDNEKIMFQWDFISDKNNIMQTGYRLQVIEENYCVFDTGKIQSSQSINIKYEGNPLKSHTHYDVILNIWTNDNSDEYKSFFETSFLNVSTWKAKWICTDKKPQNVPTFIKQLDIKKPIKSAKLYSTAKGVYDIFINHQSIHDDYLRPGWTNYKKRHQYQTYDVTKLITDHNLIEMTVAPGWYVGYYGGDGKKNHYGTEVQAALELHIMYTDGSKELIVSDENWQWKESKIISSEIYFGEVFDYRQVIEEKHKINTIDMNTSILISEESEPVKIIKRLPAIKLIKTPAGETVIDFGQNMSGIVECQINAKANQTIKIRHAEVLDKNGNFYTTNLRTALATDVYTLKEGNQIIKPRFTYHGFRYIAIEGIDDPIDLKNFTALALSTDIKTTATFECSNELVNQLWSNINWGMNSNFVDIPTDCPQRDERLGWTGDTAAFVQTASQIKDTYAFYSRWLKDLASEQTKTYGVPHVVPNILGDHGGAALWSDSATIIPWTVYQYYGDVTILENQYESMKNWVDTMQQQETELHLRQTGHQYGDWLALDKEEFSNRPMGATDPYLIASIFYAYSTKILYQTADILGFEDNAKSYKALYEQIIEGIQKEYITNTGRLVTETQTACALVLMFDIAQKEHIPSIKAKLLNNIDAHGGHLTTGFIGTPFVCHALSKVGAGDVAGKLLLKEDYPSWLQEVKLGATTIWERWNSMREDGSFDESGMNSFNHYAFGSIGSWMIEQLAGIKPLTPGYKTSIIKPQLIEGITYVKSDRLTPYGLLSSSWTCLNNVISIDVIIPANTTAEVVLPDKEEKLNLGSGSYHFEYATTLDLRPKRFTMDTPISHILDDNEARKIFEKHVIRGNEMLVNFLRNKTLNQLSTMNPDKQSKDIYVKILNELNQIK